MLRFLSAFAILILIASCSVKAQELITFKKEKADITETNYKLEHSPLIPGTLVVKDISGIPISKKLYSYSPFSGKVFLDKSLVNETVIFYYRIYVYDISESGSVLPYWLKEKNKSNEQKGEDEINPGFNPKDLKSFDENKRRLYTSGSIARGVMLGNNQGSSLNSNLNMQIEGELSDNLKIRASLTDQNIPIQAEGNRQNLQEFDKVFIEVFNDNLNLKAGDINLIQKEDHYLRYSKQARGAKINSEFIIKNNRANLKSSAGLAVSKGNFNRMEFKGIEGNQGPYKLTGSNNETYIVIISGSEKVYIDGELLIRGESKDYVIDYNTGEVNFTVNRIITKDSRIIVEFEYKTSSYNRFIFSSEHEYKTENSKWYIRYINESDGKNQPVDQSIDQETRDFLSSAGDDPLKSLYPSWDSTGYESDRIRYKIVDTTVSGLFYDSIFVYSTNPDAAYYSVNFSFTVDNNGNYVRDINAANGRVFKWVAPENGKPSGNYSPVTKVTTPEKHQMLSMGGEHKASENTNFFYHISLSEKDINTYSNNDSGDDFSFAACSGIRNKIINTENQKLESELEYNFIRKDFSPFESFREKEFKRNWDIAKEYSDNDEHSFSMSFYHNLNKKLTSKVNSRIIYRPGVYKGSLQKINSGFKSEDWDLKIDGRLLNSLQENYRSFFMKSRVSAERKFRHLGLFSDFNKEWKEGLLTRSDSLSGNSFDFHEFRAGINQGKSSENKWNISYEYRLDKLPVNNGLLNSTEAQKVKLDLRLLKNRSNLLNAGLQIRNLKILKENPDNIKPQNNIISQIDYNFSSPDGFITSRVFYKSGSGLELKREYSYLKVPEGQGAYTWTDYNENGTEELDEFEIAIYQDQADYIRIYRQGNDYIKTYNNNMSFSLRLEPSKIIDKNTGMASAVKKLSNRFNLSVNNKNTSDTWEARYIPLNQFVPDTSLVFINNNIRNVLSWDRLSSTVNADMIYNLQNSRNLLVNGLESNKNEYGKFRFIIKFVRSMSFSNTIGRGIKSYQSEFFPNKNYNIYYTENDIDIRFQPDINMRFRTYLNFKHNQDRVSGIYSRMISPGIEFTNNTVFGGMLNINLEYVYLKYSGESGNSLAWHMLESLEPGSNYKWTFSFQKRLSNGLQINLNYRGRKPDGIKTIHTGGIQLRAYF